MIAFILAAGYGTRLQPITHHIPKALVSVCGRPLLQHTLQRLQAAGLTHIGINSHHFPEQFVEFREQSKISFEIFHEKNFIRETGGALAHAADFLGAQDYFCVYNGDVLTNTCHQSLADAFISADCDVGLIAAPAMGKGTLYYDTITGDFLGTVADSAPIAGAAVADFISIAFYRKRFLDILQPDDRSIKPVWMRSRGYGLRIRVLVIPDAYALTIDTPSLLAQAHFDFLDGRYNLSVPESLIVDKQQRRAFARVLPSTARDQIGAYAWVGIDHVPQGTTFERTIAMPGARINEKTNYRNTIITPWEEVCFD